MKLLDGPGMGRTFVVRRCPHFLRVVEKNADALFDAGTSEWDVLDMPEDEPDAAETIHVYVRVPGTESAAWIDGPKLRGRFTFADYRHVPTMPEEDAELRDPERWQAWVTAKAEEMGVVVSGDAPR